MAGSVLGSYALIAIFRDEPRAEGVEKLLVKAAHSARPLSMSEVNHAEAKYVIIRKNGKASWESAADLLKSLPIEFHPAYRPLSGLAADFKAKHKISLADAFAAALAESNQAQLVTGDPEFKTLEKVIKINRLK